MTTLGLDAALTEISEIKASYVRDRAAFVKGADLTRILYAFGSTPASLARLRHLSENLPPDPTLPFRRTRSGRFCLDAEAGRAYRTEFQPFILTEGEDFVRHDSGVVRRFAEISDDIQHNATFQALLVFKHLIVSNVEITQRPGLDYESGNWICTAFHVRTTTTAEVSGEPALEGVHCDGVDHTMTVLLGCENMTGDSAATRLHDLRERNATRWPAANPQFIVSEWRHSDFLDTILIVDHERKHSVSSVVREDPSRCAQRDMLVLFTRRPALPGHASHQFDSVARHPSAPMDINLPLPVLRT
jgi:hypothetical protein